MMMTMESINPATNKARINTQIGKMTGLLMMLAKLSDKMSKSKNRGGSTGVAREASSSFAAGTYNDGLESEIVCFCLITIDHACFSCIENTS